MTIYLTIITTVLVLTQIIRVVQNATSLRWQVKLLESEPNNQLLKLWDKMEAAADKYLEKGE